MSNEQNNNISFNKYELQKIRINKFKFAQHNSLPYCKLASISSVDVC